MFKSKLLKKAKPDESASEDSVYGPSRHSVDEEDDEPYQNKDEEDAEGEDSKGISPTPEFMNKISGEHKGKKHLFTKKSKHEKKGLFGRKRK